MLKRRIRVALVFCAVLVLATVGGVIHLATGVRSEGHGVEIKVVQGDPSVLDDVEISAGCLIPPYYRAEEGGYMVNYEVAFANGEGALTTEVLSNSKERTAETSYVMGHLRYTYPKLSYGRYVFTGDQIDVDYHVVIVDGTESWTVEGVMIEDYITFSVDSRIPVYYQSIQVGYGDYEPYCYREQVRSLACVANGKTYFFMGDMLSEGYQSPYFSSSPWGDCTCYTYAEDVGDVERFEGEPENCNVEDLKYTINTGLYMYDGENVSYVGRMENAKGYRNYHLFYSEEAQKFIMLGQRGTEVLMHIWSEGDAEMTEILLGTTESDVKWFDYSVGEMQCYVYYEEENNAERLFGVDIGESPEVLWTTEIVGAKAVEICSLKWQRNNAYFTGLDMCRVGERIYLCQINALNYGAVDAELLVIENGEIIFEGIISLPLNRCLTEPHTFLGSYKAEDVMFPVSVSQGYLRITDVSITPKK